MTKYDTDLYNYQLKKNSNWVGHKEKVSKMLGWVNE